MIMLHVIRHKVTSGEKVVEEDIDKLPSFLVSNMRHLMIAAGGLFFKHHLSRPPDVSPTAILFGAYDKEARRIDYTDPESKIRIEVWVEEHKVEIEAALNESNEVVLTMAPASE